LKSRSVDKSQLDSQVSKNVEHLEGMHVLYTQGTYNKQFIY